MRSGLIPGRMKTTSLIFVLLLGLNVQARPVSKLCFVGTDRQQVCSELSFEDQRAIETTLSNLGEHFSGLINKITRIEFVPSKSGLTEAFLDIHPRTGEFRGYALRFSSEALTFKSDLSSYMEYWEKISSPSTPESLRLRFQFLIPSRPHPTLYYLILNGLAQTIWNEYRVDQFQLKDFSYSFTLRALAYKKGNVFTVTLPDGTVIDLLEQTKDPRFKGKYSYIDRLLKQVVNDKR